MVERKSWAVQQVDGVGQNTVEDARLATSALWAPSGLLTSRTGLVPGAGPGEVTATDPTPDGSVHVAPFRAVLQSGRGGGVYTMCLDATKDVDVLATAPADPSNDRIDLIVFQQSDAYFLDPNSNLLVRHVVGTAATTPTAPPVDGSSDYIVKAEVLVPAGAVAIDQANITNRDLPWTAATGGTIPVRSLAERDAISNPYNGMRVWRQDRKWTEGWDGVAWRVLDVAICSSASDRDTAITNPRSGQLAQLVNAGDTLWQYDGATSAWKQLARGEDGIWKSYTPTWATSGTQPNLGNGALTAEWCRNGDVVHVRVSLTWGSTTTGGTNSWSFSLPITATYNAVHDPWPIWTGGGGLRDVSAFNYYSISSTINSAGDTMGGIYSSGQVSASGPFTWAEGDHMTLNATYRAA
jgi:hypothetical protein